MRIGLVGCTKSKRERRVPARDLYSVSALFRGRVAFVEKSCDQWLVLSAKHGVVHPDQELDPYDLTLVGAGMKRKRDWATRVLDELRGNMGELRGKTFEIHAGRDYWGFGLRDGLARGGASVVIPTEGLGQGQQLQFYSRLNDQTTSA